MTPNSDWLKNLPEMIVKGLPNFLGLLIAVYLLFIILTQQNERIEVLTNALLACSRAIN